MTSSPTFRQDSRQSYETDTLNSLSIGSALLSLMGSMTIVGIIFRQDRFSSTYGRLIFGMSCMDIMQSLAYSLSTLPSPNTSTLSNSTWPLLGNSTTCSIQGFFLYTGNTGTTIYYCSLCMYYVLVVLKGMTLKSIKHRFEIYFHAIPLLFCFTCGIFLAVTENFNNAISVCWIAPFPFACRHDVDACTRGKNAMLFRWIFHGIPIIICFIIILVTMICLSYKMRRQRNLMQKYQFNIPEDAILNNISRNQHSHYTSSRRPSSIETTSKTATYRALQYIAASFFTIIFTIINQIILVMSSKYIFVLLIFQTVTNPAQGFFNFIVFIRPIVRAVQKGDPEIPLFKALCKAIISRKKEEEEESTRDNRSKVDKLRKPNLNRKGFTARELHQQQKDREAVRFTVEANGEESKEEERSFYRESVHSIDVEMTDVTEERIQEEIR